MQSHHGLRTNPYATVVKEFEQVVAEYAGARYGVAVDTCTAAIFLALKYYREEVATAEPKYVEIPARTYCSVPNAAIHAGYKIKFTPMHWTGEYRMSPTFVVDSACHFAAGMYIPGTYRCLSFQYRKHISIGRGGMILTNDPNAYEWFKLARFNGRPEVPLNGDIIGAGTEPQMIGWPLHMEPERAARGLNIMMHAKPAYYDLDIEYPDLSKAKIYQPHIYNP